MKVTENTKEWASVGAGALVSGALAVVLVQAAIVRKPNNSVEYLEQARERSLALEQEQKTSVEFQPTAEPMLAFGGPQERLLLPESSDTTTNVVLPEPVPVLLGSEPTENETLALVEPVELPGHLESALGKDALESNPGQLAGAKGRLVAELGSNKSQSGTGASDGKSELLPSGSKGKIGDKILPANERSAKQNFRPQTSPVNAGYDGPEVRSPAEEFSWNVHNAFQNDDGPTPFFYTDQDTGTLMFGLGWQH